MKRVIISLMFCFVTVYLFGQDFYMYVRGQKRYFEISESKMLVKSETLDASDIQSAMRQSEALVDVKNVYELHNHLSMVDVQVTSRANLVELQRHWNSREDVLFASPVFVDEESGREIGGLTNQALVRLRSEADYPLLQKAIAAFQIETVRQCEFDKQVYLLTVMPGAEKNAMQVANELYETGLFEYAEPNLIQFIELATNDQHYQQQWGLHHNLYGIKAPQAWNITTGSPYTRIAILDVGVELDHPDLESRLLSGFDATGNNSGGAVTNLNTGDRAHGTACAGIAAARANNGIGIAGVAHDCWILPVRVALSSGLWTQTETNFIRIAIDWARTSNTADVISMSFRCEYSDALDMSIFLANTTGRTNNLGCVLVASAGNANSQIIDYPAIHPSVIAVGGINNSGNRSSSNWGDLDVVAPGVNIYVTDLQGSAGYNTSSGVSGNYAIRTGSSMAAPHVAGIAALILSVRPDLSAPQVRDAIELTCNKSLPGWITTPNHTRLNGAWSLNFGYGLVNAYAAVNLVAPKISGPKDICWSGTFSVVNAPAGFNWYTSSNLTINGSATGSSVSVTATSGFTGWVSVNIPGYELVRHTFYVSTYVPVFEYISGPEEVEPSGNSYFYEAYFGGPTSYEWSISGAPSSWYDVSNSYSQAYLFFYYEATYAVYVTGYNACGYDYGSMFVEAYYGRGGGSGNVYPNPVSDILYVAIDQSMIDKVKSSQQSIISAEPSFDVRLYNGQGNLLRQQFTKGGTIEFDVSNLSNGIYHLHIYDGVNNNPQMHQVVVEH